MDQHTSPIFANVHKSSQLIIAESNSCKSSQVEKALIEVIGLDCNKYIRP